MRFNDSFRIYLVIGFALIVLIGLITANIMGKSQDSVFAQNEMSYEEMLIAVEEGDFETALEKSTSLEKIQDNSEMYHYTAGLIAANAGEIQKGVGHFQRTLDINPHKVEDPMFMLQFAEVLFNGNLMDEAQEVLERCTSLPTPEIYPQYQERVAQLLMQIVGQS